MMNLPETDNVAVSASPDTITMSDTMGNAVTVPVASFMAVWGVAAQKWQRAKGINGQQAATLFDASGNPVSDTFDLLLQEIRCMRQGMILAGLIEDYVPADLFGTSSAE